MTRSIVSFTNKIAFCLLSCGIMTAQAPIQPVTWTASADAKTPLHIGDHLAFKLTAEIQDGWHVYAPTQPAGGPIPLRVAIEPNDVVEAAGSATGTKPQIHHDPSFDLETQFFSHTFVMNLPAEVKQRSAAGGLLHQVSVSVRFQSCSDRTCLPPKVVHLLVPIEVTPGA